MASSTPFPARMCAAAVILSVTLTGCAVTTAESGYGIRSSAVATTPPATTPPATTSPAPSTPAPTELPGLGPKTLANIPENAEQVVLVTGDGKNSSTSHVVLYQRTDTGWPPGATWPAHNARRGWTDDHHAGDLRSPIGVFTLSDAGGLLADPGSRLPYSRSTGFTVDGTGFEGEPLAGSFDYVGLEAADDFHRELARTALTYLDSGRRLDQTASALFTHPNTVRYRLGRLQQLTGGSLSDLPPLPAVHWRWALATWLEVSSPSG